MSYHFLCKRGIRPARTEQFLVGVEVVGTGSDDTYDYNQSTIKICINQTCVCCFKELNMWVWGGGGVSKHD